MQSLSAPRDSAKTVVHLNPYNVICLFKAFGAIHDLHGCITFDKIEIQLAKPFMLLAGGYIVFPLQSNLSRDIDEKGNKWCWCNALQ